MNIVLTILFCKSHLWPDKLMSFVMGKREEKCKDLYTRNKNFSLPFVSSFNSFSLTLSISTFLFPLKCYQSQVKMINGMQL